MVARRLFLLLTALLCSAGTTVAQQTGAIAGRVTAASTLQPVAGVSVFAGDRGSLTDAQGRYRITGVNAGVQTVRAVALGYRETSQTVTVEVGQTASLDFELPTEVIALGELVVVGYGTQRAANVTGAVKQVTAEEFNTGRVVSPEELIQSKVAGVQVVDNNEPGGGISIRVRGATSINASSDPLYVIDGVPVASGGGLSAGRNPLNFLNPNDIESVTVLKDAAAAAIYGANAANGVVLIQTKTGNRQIGIEYTGSVSSSVLTDGPNMLNAEQFRAAVTQYAPGNVAQLQNANTDWFDLVTRNAMGQEHNVAFSSSGQSSAFRLSVGYLNQDGIIDGTTVERLSAGFNYNQRLWNDRLSLRSSLKGSRSADLFTPGGVISNAAQMGPTQPVNDPTAPTGFYDWTGGLTSADNPIAILALARDKGTTYRSVGNVQAEYALPFLEALKANVNLGYDITKATRETFTPSQLHSQVKTGNGGSFYRRDDSFQNGLFEAYLNYGAALGRVPGSIDLTGGYSYTQGHGEYPWIQATGLSTDLLENGGIPGADIIQNNLWIDDNKLISFFGRLNYNLKDRYLFAASVRRDGSSRFGEDNAWGTFPAVSLAWRLSEESFMEGISSLSDLKLRGSWGKTGNQSFANYQQYTTYTVGDQQSQVWFGNEWVTTVRPSAADPNIKWEETDAYNVGLDYGFANGRFSGSVDWYQKDTNDLIFTVPIAAGTNLSNFLTTNIGSMSNTGIEFSLSARVLDGGADGFSWTADFNAGHNSNELTTINPFGGESQAILTGLVAGGVGTYIQVLTPGEAINSFYVYQHKLEDGKPMYRDVTGIGSNGQFTNTPDGTINEHDLYVDLNGDNRINVDDRRPFHDPAPKWILGHSSYLKYGKLDGSFTLRAYLGNYVYNNVASNLGTYAEVTRGSPYNLHASVLETGFTQPQYLSDYYVEDASFLRMDNLTIGYNLEYRGQPMRVFGTVQNAFTLTGYSGVDPTAGLNGLDNNIYPRSRTFAAGLNVRF
ncbi:MAG TPA: SusC/RagA family TonB-linked outer membrane protein [Longimicrobiales bacterium]|nr:SusC/RagA family TonB-linked outer membrane protein [Longimicrobiales bacterium]